MEKELRERFNRAQSEESYRQYRERLEGRLGCEVGFRLAETPVFLPEELREKLVGTAREIIEQLCEPARLEKMRRAVPAQWDVPGMDAVPSMAQVDLAVVRDENGSLEPRLIELQGFPSLTAFEVIQRDAWAEILTGMPGLDYDWDCWFSGLDRESFLRILGELLLGDHNPENVILMDLEPESQKTFADFAATRILFGIDPVCPTRLVRRGRKLFRQDPARPERWLPVHRIYNRVVFDELVRKKIQLPFAYTDELEVEWVPHPNWYWVWSKYSIPFLEHPAVPRTEIVSELTELPEDLSKRYVLKPFFSFAGSGVQIEPTAEQVRNIPQKERGGWCLQERIDYTPALQSAEGAGVKVEIRMMFLRPDRNSHLLAAQNLCRLSRGAMMGVDYNKDLTWVGSSVGIWPKRV